MHHAVISSHSSRRIELVDHGLLDAFLPFHELIDHRFLHTRVTITNNRINFEVVCAIGDGSGGIWRVPISKTSKCYLVFVFGIREEIGLSCVELVGVNIELGCHVSITLQ